MRIIDADTLIPLFIEKAHTIENRHGVKLGEDWLLNYNDIKDVIDNAPTVPLPDFKEGYKQAILDGKTNFSRPQGKWLLCEDTHFSRCSICGDIWLNEECWNYCSNCGAKMKGGDSDD